LNINVFNKWVIKTIANGIKYQMRNSSFKLDTLTEIAIEFRFLTSVIAGDKLIVATESGVLMLEG
jgi:hypothetical protein